MKAPLKQNRYGFLFTILITALLLVGCNPQISSTSSSDLPNNPQENIAVYGTPGLEYALIEGKQEYQLVGEGTATDENMVVASIYNGLPVTQIADNIFLNPLGEHPYVDMIKSLVIPEGITSIGDNSFSDCDLLESVTLPNSLTHIGERAFYSNQKLREVGGTVEKGLRYLGNESNPYIMLFYINEPESLTTVEINPSCKFIGATVFYNTTQITEVNFPEGVLEIGYQPFTFCNELTTVYLPYTLKRVGTNLFKSCKKLQTVYYAGTVNDWNNIKKDYRWDFLMTTPLTHIICTDGEITLN